MLKKTALIICLLVIAGILFSCNKSEDDQKGTSQTTVSTEENTEDPEKEDNEVTTEEPWEDEPMPPESLPRPLVPISFDGIDKAVDFVRNPVYREFYKDHRETYEEMIKSFADYGYIITAFYCDSPSADGKVVLYPELNNTDIGVHYFFKTDSGVYQVLVYTVKQGYEIDPEKETVLDYYQKRFKASPEQTVKVGVEHPLMKELAVTQNTDGSVCAHSMISSTHYVVIKTVCDMENAPQLFENFVRDLAISYAPLEEEE